MNAKTKQKMCIDCYKDAVAAGLPVPIVVVIAAAGSALGRAIAERHITFFSHDARATIINHRGMTKLRPIKYPTQADVVQAWSLDHLLAAMADTGCPPFIIEKYRANLRACNEGHCWLFGIQRSNKIMLAPLKTGDSTNRETARVTPRDIILRNLSGMVDPFRQYPRAIPSELATWYCYTYDGGHNILVVLHHDYRVGMSLDEAADLMVPAPVKTVLRGYQLLDRVVTIVAPLIEGIGEDDQPTPYYSREIGLVCDESDDEF